MKTREPAVPGVLPPRYRVLATLKEGTETSVYHVLDQADRRELAIKVLWHELQDAQQLLRFKTEFATLAGIDHRNVVKVYDFGLLENRHPYFTMEYCAGKRITDAFDGQSWTGLYEILLQIAAALHHIHHLGLVHLDLKPSNILITADGQVRLMDFGLAIEGRQVLDRRIRGTLQYMPPEVLRQDRVDSRADQYSLGMTLYETVTGALPGYGRSVLELIRMHLDEPLRNVAAINPSVPERLEKIITRLLEKDPRHRYPSAAALFEAVAEAAGTSGSSGLLLPRGELYAAPLIGRRQEVEQLLSMVAAAREGRGSGVIIAGAEGMGKSRIVRDVTLRAQLDGARVFCGRCPTNGRTVYAPFFEIFEQMVRAVNPAADVTQEIRRMLRPSNASGGTGTAAGTGQRYRLYNRIVQSMQDLYGFLSVSGENGGSPLILVVEDLQWADASTAELLTFLVEEARHNRLLLIATLTLEPGSGTSIETAPPGLGFWEQRAREGEFPILRVEAMGEPGVREHLQALLGESEVPDEFVKWIQWESAGSPLAIRRIVDHLVTHEYLVWRGGGWRVEMDRIRPLRIPGGVAAILMERVELLPPDEKGLIEIAAVAGEKLDLELLSVLSEHSPEATFSAATSLVRRGLLDEMNDGATLAFPQIHLRDAIYTGIPERRRSEIHLRAAEALEPVVLDGGTRLLGQLAYHFSRASEVERGTRYSVEAGNLAMRTLAFEEAADFYRSALELMDLGGVDEARKAEVREKLADAYARKDDHRSAIHAYQFLLKSFQSRNPDDEASPDVARLMKKIAKVLERRGDFDPATAYYQSALAISERLDAVIDVAEMLNRLAWIYRLRDDLDAACEHAERAESLLAPLGPSTVLGYVKNVLGLIEYARGDWGRARAILEEAVAVGEASGSDQLRKIATTNLGMTLWKLGDWDRAMELFQRNLERSEADGDLLELVTAYTNVGLVEYGRGEFRAAAGLFEKSLRIDEKIGATEGQLRAREKLGDSLEMLGHWDEAMEHYLRCLPSEGPEETRAARLSVCIPLARLSRKRGDITRALEYAQRALSAGERARDEDLIAEASYVLASIEDERGDLEAAERYLQRAGSVFAKHGTVHGQCRVDTATAVLALQRGALDEAVRLAEAGERRARSLGDRYTIAKVDWTWGKILSGSGDRADAAARFDTARVAFEELDTPYEEGRLLFDIGVLRDDPDEATAMLRNAIRLFERLGAANDLERARGALFRIHPAGKAPEQGVIGLYEIVKIINSTLDLQEVLHRVLDVCVRRLRAERGMILLLDPITGALRTRVVRNIREGADDGSSRSPQSVIRDVIASSKAIISADARADDRFATSDSVIAENIVSIVCAPIVIKDRVAGAIYIDHRETRHLFSQKDLSFLEAFADQAAIAIENARLYEELEEARTRLSLENETLRREVLVEKHLDSVIGQSEAVARIQFAIRKASAGHSTVLLRGESGTGKGLVARIIHNVGPRRNGPFIKFNCAALPETLAESELFGHEKGAFTGADRRKLGRFELANNGSIFLDEIGKMTLAMQAKLLRVVEEKEFERVGGTQTIKTDVKIIAATNLELEKAIEEGTFREDLFYRLNIVPIVLPPLRDRKDDIPLLVEHFIRKICKDLGIDNRRLGSGVLERFLAYDWPGNVRELEATLHRAIVMSNDAVLSENEFFQLQSVSSRAGRAERAGSDSLVRRLGGDEEINGEIYDAVLASVDRQLILHALERSGGKIREAARRLGLARNTLKSKIQKYNIAVREN